MVDSQAELAITISYLTSASGIIVLLIKGTMCNDCFFGSGNELLNSENELLINEDLSNRNAVKRASL